MVRSHKGQPDKCPFVLPRAGMLKHRIYSQHDVDGHAGDDAAAQADRHNQSQDDSAKEALRAQPPCPSPPDDFHIAFAQNLGKTKPLAVDDQAKSGSNTPFAL